ncbi:tetratricopeptide repeat protein [Parahaliea mediterranea]|uniref:Tetratricopeptide repeat protein n=1 Tax=Parahaliea mediterranea TaxID=651086 RepID=A0A939IIT1_9GAMM|nr:tetratricopeptide repeat protein [Parahaliea mediterranea]MBN7795571.1 tetratricopeptide repeat protein [Parahaliea mediterranea]
MAPESGTASRGIRGSRLRAGAACCLLAACLVSACARNPLHRAAVDQLPPLQWDGNVVTVAEVAATVPSPDLLGLSQEMRDFVARYAATSSQPRQRLVNLHRAVKGAGMLDLQYDPFADGTAAEAFNRASANCLTYAHLFVALAREAGLDARYQWLEVRPQWTRMGERVALRMHVNVLVDLPRGESFMVDIDPLQSRDIADSHPLRDSDGAALYHSNLAVDALAGGDLPTAWRQSVRALQLSPAMAQLWVNLGAIYRGAGQLQAAEDSYFRALKLNPGDRSAMNNLVVLYAQLGREDERAYWVERVERHREANPFYHAWLGDNAADEGAWDEALAHYRRALKLRPQDSRLLYAEGIIHYRRGDFDAATARIGEAIDRATLKGDIDQYRLQLEAVRREATAAL